MKFDILMGVIKTVNFSSLKIHSREFIPLPTAFNWQLIDTVKSNNRTGVRHGRSNWKKNMSLSRSLHFYEISEITATRIFKGF